MSIQLIRPRLTDYHGVHLAQAELSFAIPFFDEDVPLYVDPFLLWKSPSYQDKSLHSSVMRSFNNLGHLFCGGKSSEAVDQLILASECEEVGLGLSANRKGKRIGAEMAKDILSLFEKVGAFKGHGFSHIEEVQLFVNGFSADRVSDIACNFMKSFLVDFTIDQCAKFGIPVEGCNLRCLYNLDSLTFDMNVPVTLPVNPKTKDPMLLVPKRWLRRGLWINFDEYYKDYCPCDDKANPGLPVERVSVLDFNRNNYGIVELYIKEKERGIDDCRNDPLFSQIPISSARRKMQLIKSLPTGKDDNADMKYEDNACQLLASLLYPYLDFAAEQVRTESGVSIRDLVFYNNRGHEFLDGLYNDYGSRQIVMELKNVQEISRDHVNQLNRYIANSFGQFGVLVTRNELKKARSKSVIDLWSGQRKSIVTLTDMDLDQMVELYESKQRHPIDVLKKKYIEFRRSCPV